MDRKDNPGRLQRRAANMRGVGFYTVIPTMMVAGPVFGYLGGAWLEGRVGYAPWVSFAGVVLGAAASVRQIIVILRRANEREQKTR